MQHSIVGKRSPKSLLLYVSDSNIHQMTLVLLRKHEKDRLKIVTQRRLGLIGIDTLGYDVTTFEFPSQKQERKGRREPSFASNLKLNFEVLIRPY